MQIEVLFPLVDVVYGSHLGLQDSVVCSAERLCEVKLCCLRYRRKVSVLWLIHKIYHRVDYPMSEYLHHFVVTRNTRSSAALGELALVILRCGTDQVGRSFLPADVRLWNLLHSGVFGGGTLILL